MSTYRSLYTDVSGVIFVGDLYTIDNSEELSAAIAAERQVLRDIKDLAQVEICLVEETLTSE